MSGDDIRRLDRPWGTDKIAMLVDGIIEVDGEQFHSPSVYEQRCAAESSADDFSDLILEPAQLDKAIRAGIQRDGEVRLAMLLRTRLGKNEVEIEQLLRSNRSGVALIARGIELTRRYEKGQHQQLRRVRAAKGESDQPVCWRCMTTEVAQPGMECDPCPGPPPKPQYRGLLRGTNYPGHAKAPIQRPDPSTMTEEEKAAEIQAIVADAPRGDFDSDDRAWRRRVIPIGDIRSPSDVAANDRAYRRKEGRPWKGE